ncbi:unnamed protein product [Diabrotica balteata]|uniref:Tetratricopeptide repeat protein n=1 Tax=Diabrotica balteata TaxID=107213 RepID=A0A9N9XF66_DIABA|nr:unnamed protein product [Diabrotica balteata]
MSVLEKNLQKRKREARKEGDNELLVATCTNLSDVYMESGRFQLAIKEYKVLARLYKAKHKYIDYAGANRAIGEAHLELKKFKTALAYHKRYLDTVKSENHNVEIQRAYASIGHVYLTEYLETQSDAEQNLNEAYSYFERSMRVCESFSLVNKLEKADMQARLFSNLGLVKELLGDFTKAIEFYIKSKNICKENHIYEQLISNYMSLAALYEKKKEMDKTIHYYNLAVEAIKNPKGVNITLACTALQAKAEVLIKLNDFHAAKKLIFRAHKLRTSEDIIRNLRIVATICDKQTKILKNDSRKMGKRRNNNNLNERAMIQSLVIISKF